MPAIIGAVYLHQPEAANALVLRLIEPLVDEPGRFGASMDPKTTLQELAAQLGRPAPTYAVTESGPDHRKRFMAELRLGDALVSAGEGTSKKQAELSAALDAVLFLQSQARAPSEERPRPPSPEA